MNLKNTIGLLAAATLSAGCIDQMTPLEVTGVFATDTTTCLPGAEALLATTVDVDVVDAAAAAAIRVENSLASNASTTDFRTSSHDVTIDQVDVRYLDLKGAPVSATPVSLRVFGFVPAGGTFGMGTVPIAPKDVVAATKTLDGITAVVRFSGHQSDGTSISTAEIEFPVYYCRGCSLIPDCVDASNVNQTEFVCDGGVGLTKGVPGFATCPLAATP